jgi:hypothetical protein
MVQEIIAGKTGQACAHGRRAIPLRDRIISQVVYYNQLIDYNIDLIELSSGPMLTSVFDHRETASGRARADWLGTG